jgi:hypothetical protein
LSEENVSDDEADDKDIGDEGTSDVYSFMEDKRSCNTPSMLKYPVQPSR